VRSAKENPVSEETIFHDALAKPSAERAAFLDAACAGQPKLRAAVEALLAAHEDSGSLLDEPPRDLGRTGDSDPGPAKRGGTGEYTPESERRQKRADLRPQFEPGLVIAGRYKLLEQIGEGGMGAVWVAEQTQPVKRKVALKLIKAGMDSKSVLARFEAERQALAVMDHPNIAKVLDGGLTETGQPYFVMEYVKGVPITEYCDATRMNVSERLNLFVQVCSAVQHAHQKGIIHRDLKPSNILVAPYDDKPIPKVIDFGLAKAMHQSLTDRTLHTAHETVLGTPLYMSPEQAQLNNLDVDTRSDIYSLGVLLYELLTGTTPLEKQRFKEAAWDEMKRLIREEEAPRPSTRLSSSNTLASLAAGRQIEPAKLTKLIRGELDWIVMKSLEKDRTRRYETANGFALDIQRYLAGEPVLAAPPSARYRLGKFARKHRTALTTAAAIALLLVASAAISTWQAVRATNAENAALQAQRAEADRAEGERLAKLDAQAKKADAERAQVRAEAGEKLAGERLLQVEAEKKRADEEKQIAQAVRDFLQQKLLSQADTKAQADTLVKAGASSSGAKLNPTIRELLDRAALQLAPDKIEASFPKQPLIQAELLQTVGGAYGGIGEFQPAIDFLKRSEALRRQYLGPEHPDTLASMNNLALTYQDAGRRDEALPLYEETLKLRKAQLGPEHPDTLQSMNNLAFAYRDAGKLDLAVPLLEETFKLRKAKLGHDHRQTLTSMNNLALAYQGAGKLDLALPLFEEALKLFKAKFGPEHPRTLVSMNNLALAYQAAGKLDRALPLFEEALKLFKAKLGPEHPGTLTSMNNLALAYRDAGKLDLALPLFEETLKLFKAKLGPEHPRTLGTMNNLALGYRDAGKLDLALPLFDETLKLHKTKLGLDHPATLTCMANLAQTYRVAGKLDLALPLLEETLKLRKAKLGLEHPDTLQSMNNLASAYVQLKLFDKVELLYREQLRLQKQNAGVNSPAYAGALAALGLNLLHQRKWTEAEPLLREFLAIREKTQPDVWSTFNTKSQLGGALLGQKKYTDAEPLLLDGYEGMKQREKTNPPQAKMRITEAIERLVQLYEATDKKDETAKWRKTLESQLRESKK
jgi:eukaryotic-like serine/threonine-protein kinase